MQCGTSTVAELVADEWCDALEFRGRVVDASGQPAANARVSIGYRRLRTLPWESITLVSGNQGEFRFRARIESGELSQLIVIGHDSDGSQNGIFRFPALGGEPPKELVLRLAKSRILDIVVRDRDGSAVRGALVGVSFRNHPIPLAATTGADGRARFHQVFSSEPLMTAAAWKSDVGFAYYEFSSPDRGVQGVADKRAPADSRMELTLDGVAPLSVQVVDDEHRPVVGMNLVPAHLKKEGARVVGPVEFASLLGESTNEKGLATFRWWPRWAEPPQLFYSDSKEFDIRSIKVDPHSRDAGLTVIVDRRVSIRGVVRHADGRPADRTKVLAVGADVEGRASETTAVTDANGRYEVKVRPNGVYFVVASGKRLTSAPQTSFAVWPRTPIEGLDLTLRTSTRVHGTLVNNVTQKPIENEKLVVTRYGVALSELKDIELPDRVIPRARIRPKHEVSTMTDERGRFELFLGDGTFRIQAPQRDIGVNTRDAVDFRISGESERELIVKPRMRPRTTE